MSMCGQRMRIISTFDDAPEVTGGQGNSFLTLADEIGTTNANNNITLCMFDPRWKTKELERWDIAAELKQVPHSCTPVEIKEMNCPFAR